MPARVEKTRLKDATERRYLSYALSVITSRALPDIRDGLKPVQRRILYAMHTNLRLLPEAKHRKSAAVVGEVMAKYHPHGDQAIYDAMVRMAQDFAMRVPLVDGQGNFGSVDGDGAAAMRYTEAKLRHLAVELLDELKKQTVPFRANYDGTQSEPIVLPARVPNLLVNGSTGIAVGMATNIPPHHLGEVIDALVALIDEPELELEDIVGPIIRGPDFPTGGEILNEREALLDIYRTGSGPIELQGTWFEETENRRRHIVIDSIPFALNKSNLIADIADHIRLGKVPQLVDIRDESTDVCRIVLDLKRGANAEAAMAYLYKRTALRGRFHVNLTALVPTDDPEVCRPERLDLVSMLRHFLRFREEVTRRRLTFDLAQLEKRIHILEAFAIIFDALDEAIALIRASNGKKDARERLMERFELDWDQAEAILETKLYRLAKLEIDDILAELAEKRAEAERLRAILGSDELLWNLVRDELVELRDAFGDERRTRVVGQVEEKEFSEEIYIIAEDAWCIVTREGWLKRQKSYTDVSAIRVRDGDEVGWIWPASTRESLIVFTDRGKAYTLRVDDVPATTGYGEALSTRFDFEDGERVVGVTVSDARALPMPEDHKPKAPLSSDGAPHVVAMSRGGRTLQLPLGLFAEPSTRNGRTVMRLAGGKLPGTKVADRVVAACVSDGSELVSLATRQGRALIYPVEETKALSGPGKGVLAIKLAKGDHVVGFALATHRMDGLDVETNRGRREVIRSNKFSVASRAGKGREIIRNGTIAKVHHATAEHGWRADEAAARDEDGDLEGDGDGVGDLDGEIAGGGDGGTRPSDDAPAASAPQAVTRAVDAESAEQAAADAIEDAGSSQPPAQDSGRPRIARLGGKGKGKGESDDDNQGSLF